MVEKPAAHNNVGHDADSTVEGDDEDVVLELSRPAFVIVWWSMLLVHASIAAFLFANNLLYEYMGNMSLIYYNKLLDSDLAGQLAHVGWLFSVAGAVHCLEMLKMLLFSLHARELSFRYQMRTKTKVVPALPGSVIAVRQASGASATCDSSGAASSSTAPPPTTPPPPALVPVPRPGRLHNSLLTPLSIVRRLALAMHHRLAALVPRCVKVAARRVGRALLRVRRALYDKRHGYMSVQSKYFHYLFLIRETIEIASQSYQMYNAAALLARPWVNAFFLSLVVINCWSTPLLQHALAHSTGLERVLCLVLDGLLDAGSAILIPLVVFLPYARAFDADALSFPSTLLYDPQWFVNMVRENRMLFAMSTRDLVSKLVPHHSLYSCMKNVKKFMVRKPTSIQRYSPMSATAGPSAATVVKASTAAPITKSMTMKKKKKKPIEYPSRGKRLVHVVFTCWGIAVLVIYLHARQVSVHTDVSACKLALRPWFVTTFACAAYTFDCHEQSSVESLTSSDLALLHKDYLAALVVANCPALVMPSELQQFPNLLKFLLYNSTIVAWDLSASLNARNHTTLVSIGLVRVNMTAFPLGLQDTLPSPLQDFQVSTSNLTALPATIAMAWKPLIIYYFEHCDFDAMPLELLQLRCDYFSLAGSRIAALPTDTSSAAFPWVNAVFSHSTQLTELPASGFRTGLQTLSIEHTGVAAMPSWVTSSINIGPMGLDIYAYNTPYCINQLAAAAAASSPGSDSSSDSTGGSATTAPTTVAPATSSGTSSLAAPTTTAASSSGDGTGTATGKATVHCETRDPSGESRYPLALTTAAFQPR